MSSQAESNASERCRFQGKFAPSYLPCHHSRGREVDPRHIGSNQSSLPNVVYNRPGPISPFRCRDEKYEMPFAPSGFPCSNCTVLISPSLPTHPKHSSLPPYSQPSNHYPPSNSHPLPMILNPSPTLQTPPKPPLPFPLHPQLLLPIPLHHIPPATPFSPTKRQILLASRQRRRPRHRMWV